MQIFVIFKPILNVSTTNFDELQWLKTVSYKKFMYIFQMQFLLSFDCLFMQICKLMQSQILSMFWKLVLFIDKSRSFVYGFIWQKIKSSQFFYIKNVGDKCIAMKNEKFMIFNTYLINSVSLNLDPITLTTYWTRFHYFPCISELQVLTGVAVI